ncbi:hypothetical protein [Vagococcus silagei]|uniref:Glycine zipper-like domain-containing protein n=1 Tax=Vagococcus silagei TaxID=2508885 RepID=A0A4S3B4C8_9ENTE|nr:hypothetical protein [Vagococcus silagei]THB60473.1 hypothetical protein ESZ54_10360 [Vagococcus silagei]
MSNKISKQASYVSLGLIFGAAFGIIFDSIPIGVGLGLCFGATLDMQQKDSKLKRSWYFARFYNLYFV